MASAFTLTIVNGPEPEKKFAFLQKTVNLGRSAADNDVIINENSISGQHARIICEKNQLFLQDLGSTNKTRYNDTVLGKGDKQLLQSGTEFRLGNIVLRFEVQTAPAGAQAGTAGTRAMGVRGLADKIKLGDQGPLKSRPVMVAGAGLFMLIVVLLFVKALMEPGEEPLPEID
ncbi:MAG: FHA domain-containing protein, partial [Deltaproteobacteria bacterium]|nr:FHA domain-containing protein [Deltaproteobacteria bacterium]